MYKNFEFQAQAADDIESHLEMFNNGEDVDNFLICIPTGGGKTYTTARGLKQFIDNNKGAKLLFIVNLQCLVSQTYKTLKNLGINVSVVHNTLTHTREGTPFTMGFSGNVIITMPETYVNILNKDGEFTLPEDFSPVGIIFDEAHKATSDLNQEIKDYHRDSLIIGLTASPHRPVNKEGEHLKQWYGDNLYQYTSITDLINLGLLVKPRYFEFEEEDSIVDVWKEFTNKEIKEEPTKEHNHQTIVFTQNTDQSVKLKQAFLNAGIPAEIITAGSDSVEGGVIKHQTQKERDVIYNKFAKKVLRVLISVNALCEGYDEPIARICVYSRRVNNKALYQQIGGRVLRAHDSKTDAILLDFYKNLKRLGPIEHIEWDLNDDTQETVFVEEKSKVDYEKARVSKIFHICTSCNHVYDVTKFDYCTNCNRSSGIQIVETVGNLIKKNTNLDNTKVSVIRDMISKVKGAYGYQKDEVGIFYRNKLNKEYSSEIFDKNGDITPEFKWMIDIKDLNNIKGNTEIKMKVSKDGE